MATLNAAYAGLFSFSLASATQYTTGSTDVFNADTGSSGEASIKQQLRRGSAQTLNIYTWEPRSSSGSTTLGWATFPWSYSGNPQQDGVVLQFGSINGGSLTNYNLGDTAVHEVGHWLGLYHTFQVRTVNFRVKLHNVQADFLQTSCFVLAVSSGCQQ